MMSDGQPPLFVYGTLRDPRIRRGVLGHDLPGDTLSAATAWGWETLYFPGHSFPALVRRPEAACAGLLLHRLSARDLERLDAFEGAQYRRAAIAVEGHAMAHTYLPAIPIPDTTPLWRFALWARRHRDDELRRYEATGYSGRPDPQNS